MSEQDERAREERAIDETIESLRKPTLRSTIEGLFLPCIDVRAPYARHMINELVELASPAEEDRRDARRYRYLRERDVKTISAGGVFAGLTPQNVVLSGNSLDCAVDEAMGQPKPELDPDVKVLREALMPLGALGVARRETILHIDYVPFFDCPDDLVLYNDNMGHAITVGDVRRAWLLLSQDLAQ
jgi:hypothetical protein